MDKNGQNTSHLPFLPHSEMELKVWKGGWALPIAHLPLIPDTEERMLHLGERTGGQRPLPIIDWVPFKLHAVLRTDQSPLLPLLLGRH